MNAQTLIVTSALTGIGWVVVWVMFWSFFVPAVFSRQIWEGYEVLIVPVFFIGTIVGALFYTSGGNGPSGGRRRR